MKILIFGSMTLDLYFCRLKKFKLDFKDYNTNTITYKKNSVHTKPFSLAFQHNQMDKFRKEVKMDIFLTPLDNACQFCTIHLKLLAPKTHQFSYWSHFLMVAGEVWDLDLVSLTHNWFNEFTIPYQG
jgi:hypothetical protein